MCITAGEIEKKISPRTKAIIPVHLFGHPAPMNEIMELANARGLVVLEDAAQSVGTKLDSKRAGAMGHLAAFSFFPTKNLGAAGDGGALTTDGEQIAILAKKMRNHGSLARYDNEMLGYNSRLDAVQAAALSVKLRHLDRLNAQRRANAETYRALIHAPQLALPTEAHGAFHTYHQFTIRALDGRRDALAKHLADKGVGTAVYYPTPVHKLAPFAGAARDEDLPNTMQLARQVLSLPIFPELRRDEIEYVAKAIGEFYGN